MKVDYNISCMFPQKSLFDFVPMGTESNKSISSEDVTIESLMRESVERLVANGLNRKHISASAVDDYETPCINIYITDNVNTDKLSECLGLAKLQSKTTLKTLTLSDVYNVVSFSSSREIA